VPTHPSSKVKISFATAPEAAWTSWLRFDEASLTFSDEIVPSAFNLYSFPALPEYFAKSATPVLVF